MMKLATSTIPDRRRRPWRTPGRVVVPLGLAWAFGAAVIAVASTSHNPQRLFFDPSFSGNDPKWYVGIVSQLGILGWSIAALSAAWSAWFARHVGRPGAARFLGRGAVVTAILLVDDLFDFHAVFGSVVGVPKPVLQLLVVAPVGLWLTRHSVDILRTRWPLLFASIGALVASIAVERLTGNSFGPRATLAEDGPKFLGILAWATYFSLTSLDIARSVLTQTHVPRIASTAPDHAAAEGAATLAPQSRSR
jgi:hypothetical protein